METPAREVCREVPTATMGFFGAQKPWVAAVQRTRSVRAQEREANDGKSVDLRTADEERMTACTIPHRLRTR
ncbi:hypothetical protein [Haladaptatus halobius]|uniref:hypothetical protein n=1 Tax=Haladaptatus halobius TaxID=2884875 RepID=UPI001D0ACFE1|nr:hypothetical protein [Haladaptatus halobius]